MSAGEQERQPSETAASSAVLTRAPLYVLAVLVFLTPLITANLTALGGSLPLLYDAIALPRLALSVLGALLAWLLFLYAQSSQPRELRWNVPLAALDLLAGLAVISALFALDPRLAVLGQSERLEGVAAFITYAMLFGIALQVVRSGADVRLIAGALVAAAIVSALYGLAQWAGFDPSSYAVSSPGFDVRRAFATFENPNFLAGLLVLAVPLAAAFAARVKSAAWAVGLWAVTALVTVALLTTFTRGALIALVVEVVVFVALLLTKRVVLTRHAWWGSGAVTALVAAAGVASIGRGGEIDLAERITGSLGQASLADRFLGWQAAADASLARPVLGYGPDSFVAAFRLHRPDAYAEVGGLDATLGNAHSWPLQIAATVGIPAALALVVAIGAALWIGLSVIRRQGSTPALADPVFVGAWIGCVGFCVHMLSSVATPGTTTPFWILLGAVTVPAARTVSASALSSAMWRGATVAAGVVAVGAVIGAGAFLSADSSYLQARAAYRGDGAGDARQLAARAVELNPLSIKYDRGFAEIVADDYYNNPGADALATADEQFEITLDRYPNDYAGLAWHAALLASGSEQLDPALADQAATVAQAAAEFDRHAIQVEPIAEGQTDRIAVLSALSVPGLP